MRMYKALQRMMLFALVALFGSAMANAETTTVTWDAASGDALTTIFVGDDLTLTWAEANGNGAPRYSNGYARMLKDNTLTVAGASEEVTITQVVVAFKSSDDPGLTANVGSVSNDYTNITTTWTGEANSVKFKASSARNIKTITVTYTGKAAPVEKVPVLAITQDGIADTYDMDANGVFVVYYENKGNAVAENTKLTLFVDGQENNAKEIGSLNFGANNLNFWNAKYNLEGIEAGEHQVYLAMTADNAEAVQTETKTVTFTKKAPEATFTVVAENVNVEFGAESYQVVANVTNTSEAVAAEGVLVQLQRNAQDIAEAQTIDLAAGETKQVTFTVTGPFTTAGETTVWVMVKAYQKTVAQQEVTVTVAEEVVPDVKDLAVVAVDGAIDLANTTNNVRVIVQNNGNVDITDAAVTLKAGDTVLGTSTVSAAKRQTGFCYVAVASEGLTAGELAVVAVVEVEEDATPNDNTMEATLTVKGIPAPEATFTVAAENVTVPFGATSFEVKAVVKNTSEVAANGLTVKLLQGITVVEAKTLNIVLAAGEETEVTFTVEATEEAPFVAGKTATYFVQVENKAQAEVVVTFEEEPVAPVVDINLIDIRGLENINLKAEQNVVMVTFQNNSNVDVENATITLTMNGTQVGEAQTIARGEYYKSFTLPTEGLVAGETATLVATLSAENNKEGNTGEVTKTLPIISGDVEPAAEIALNPLNGWEVQAGEQTINVSVSVFNNGDADAEGVEISVYQNYPTVLATKTISVKAGESTIVTLSFDYTFEQGKSYEFTVFTGYQDADLSNNEQKFTLSCPTPVADVAVERIADIKATTEEEVKINAVLKNNSSIDATEVKVGVYTQDENYQYQIVGIQQTVETIAAGETAEVEFNLGQLQAGTYRYYVRVVTADSNLDNNMQDVKVTVTEPVVPVVNVALTAIQGISSIDLAAGANNTISVWVANQGNVDAEAGVAVKLNETELEAQTISVRAAGNAYATFVLPTEGLTVGEKAVLVATLAVDGNAEDAVTTLTREYDIVDSSVATEATFAVAADNVSVPFGATSFEIKATVKNTSAIDAQGVEVKLYNNGVVATQTIDALAAGAEQEVIFTVEATEEAPFVAGRTVTYYVQAPKAQAEVAVTFEKEATPEVVEVALTQINVANSQIDLAAAANVATVWVENKGNVAAQATIALSLNSTALEAQTITVNAGEFGRAEFTLPTEGLVAGEKATVVATVTVEGNTSQNTSETKEYDIVDSSVATEPVFEVVAENVTVPFGATSFEIKAVVKNVSEVDANGLTVKLLQGITEVEAKTLNIVLAAGEETEVSFTIEATEEAPFVAGKSVKYYVQAPNAQAEVVVTFAEQEVEKFVDMAVTAISGGLSVEIETNYLTVFVENKGNVDVNNAVVTLTAGEVVLGTAQVSAKAGNTGFCSIAVPATALQEETLVVTATVEVDNDVDLTNNTLDRTFQIALPAALVEIAVEDVSIALNQTSFVVPVTVKNLRENFAAKNVKVMIYDNYRLIGQTTVETIAAGAEVRVDVEVNVETAYTEGTTLKAWATGYSETQFVTFQLLVGGTGIAEVNAQGSMANQTIYNVAGQRQQKLQKGLNIVGGRKVVVK